MKRLINTLKERWPEYILEIIVITIGILGAFALNNWNENRKKSFLTKEILTQIRLDIEDNLSDVSNDLGNLELAHQSHLNILRYIHSDAPYADSMCFDFELFIDDEYTTANRAGFDALKEAGFDLVQNDTLKWRIKSLYETALPRISPEGAFYEHLSDFFSPYYNKHFVPNRDTLLRRTYIFENDTIEIVPRVFPVDGFNYVNTNGYVPLDFEKLKKDPEFLMLIKRGRTLRNHKLRWYRRTEFRMKNLIAQLDKILNDM